MTATTHQQTNQYARNRLISIFGSVITAKEQEGITVTENGNICIPYYSLDGSHKKFHPDHKALKNQNFGDGVDYNNNQKSIEIDYCRYRMYRKFKTIKHAKYLSPKRDKKLSPDYISLYFPSTIRSKYQKSEKITTLYITEGEFKAIVACNNGIDCISFAGISTFQLIEELKELILRCGVENIVLLYDNDCIELSSNPFGKEPLDYETKAEREKREQRCVNDRSRNFLFSATNFAKSFFEWMDELNRGNAKEEKTKIALSFTHSHANQLKAIDDMLDDKDNEGKEQIVMDLLSLKTNETFNFIRLYKTRYKEVLTKFYSLNSVRDFYKTHKDILKDSSFKFRYDGCYCVYRYCNLRKTIIVESNPFNVNLKSYRHFKCHEYISEHRNEIYDILDNNDRVFLAPPTGSGKTTLIIEYARHYIEKDKSESGNVYIVIPTVNLGTQLAKKEKRIFLYQHTEDYTRKLDKNKNKCDKRIFVCTSDCIKNKKVIINSEDLLVIDEAPNLVNQYGFRDATMRALYSSFVKAKKVIGLSATPNKLFIKNEGFKLITATVKKKNKVNYIPTYLKKNQTLVQGIISKILESNIEGIETKNLFGSEFQKQIHFVFLDDKKKLEQIRYTLVQMGIVNMDQTALFTSERQYKDSTFNEIKENQEILNPKIRIVFTTRILSEGQNTNNLNIGKIIMGNVKCCDILIQFPKRFRNMKYLDVHLIYKEQQKIDKNYFLKTERLFDYYLMIAKAHKKALELAISDHHTTDLKDPRVLLGSINSQGEQQYLSENFDLAYVDENLNVHIDYLKLYHKEYKRKTDTIPIDNLLAELAAYDHVTINNQDTSVKNLDSNTKEILHDIQAAQKGHKEKVKETLYTDLEKDEQKVLRAVKELAMEQKKNGFVEKIDMHLENGTKEEINNEDVKEYKENHQYFKNDNTYIKTISKYMVLKEYTEAPVKLLKSVDTDKEFKFLCKSLKWLKWITSYKDKENSRRHKMNALEKLDAKLFIKIQKDMTEIFKNRTFKKYEFYAELRKKYRIVDVKDLNHLVKSENFCNTIFIALFDSQQIDKVTYSNITPKTFENVLKRVE